MLTFIIPKYHNREVLQSFISYIRKQLDDVEFFIFGDNPPNVTDISLFLETAFKIARGDYICFINLRKELDIDIINHIFAEISKNSDVIIVSRYAEGSSKTHGSINNLLYKINSIGARILFSETSKIKDVFSDFFIIKKSIIDEVKIGEEYRILLLKILVEGNYTIVKEIPLKLKEKKKLFSLKETLSLTKSILKYGYERGELQRIIKFMLVGISGIVVNLGLLWLLTEVFGIYYMYSAAFSIETSIISNFMLNDIWTFRDRRLRTSDPYFKRLIKYNFVAMGGLLINLIILYTLKEFLGIHYLIADLVGIFVAFVWNFILSTLWTWKVLPKNSQRIKNV